MTQDELDIWARSLAERINNTPNGELMSVLDEIKEFTETFRDVYNLEDE